MKRIHVQADLAAGASLALDRATANRLLNVLRLRDGAELAVFNGRDGEWRARVAVEGRKAARLVVAQKLREQVPPPSLRLLFAPLRQARLDYAVQKAVEMGVGHLSPVTTAHTQATAKRDRMRVHAVEAAEQCGALALPTIDEIEPLAAVLERWDGRPLVFCDESDGASDPIAPLQAVEPGPVAVLIGPEGGFSPAERERLRGLPFVTPIPLGPRILRADTAAVAALALVQSVLGDWR